MDPPVPAPQVFVVLGATGDLMKRKLLPALYRLAHEAKLSESTVILGVARRPMDEAGFQALALQALGEAKAGTPEELRAFCQGRLRYHRLADETSADYAMLRDRLAQLEGERGLPGNRIFYLALPLEAFGPTLRGLGEAQLNRSKGWTRVVIEKPFGRDLASAVALNALAHRYFEEGQIYRIDHYLGKETVQNLLVFRFANMFVESLWNRGGVQHVEITVAEKLGLEGRASYYDSSGALRDMIQNHATQLLALIAMEPPATRDEESIRNEKVKVLRSTVRLAPEDVIRGQYTAGKVDESVPGYLEEPGIAPGSGTETYVALRLQIANWRWQDVPFFVRTGKRLPAKSTRVVVTFKAPPVTFFQTEQEYDANPDRLTILVQPDEGFELTFEVKVPGRGIRLQTHRMQFHYQDAFGELPDGYDTLLQDVILGDATLFVRADEVEESWEKLYDLILEHPPPVLPYAAGSWGPAEAAERVERWGHTWSPE